MANVMRWRYGDTNPVQMAVDSASVIEIGDLVYLDTDDAKSAAALTWNTDLVTTQEDFHDSFLGVAMQASRSGDTDSIRVATTGVFQFDSASASYEVGDYVGPASIPIGDGKSHRFRNQHVAAVPSEKLSIGRVVRTATSSLVVYVEIVSTMAKEQAKLPQTATTD